jgi:hypothetical protein
MRGENIDVRIYESASVVNIGARNDSGDTLEFYEYILESRRQH